MNVALPFPDITSQYNSITARSSRNTVDGPVYIPMRVRKKHQHITLYPIITALFLPISFPNLNSKPSSWHSNPSSAHHPTQRSPQHPKSLPQSVAWQPPATPHPQDKAPWGTGRFALPPPSLEGTPWPSEGTVTLDRFNWRFCIGQSLVRFSLAFCNHFTEPPSLLNDKSFINIIIIIMMNNTVKTIALHEVWSVHPITAALGLFCKRRCMK